jgi:hypothetical protein
MAERKPYNPNTKYGRKKLREEAERNIANYTPEQKAEYQGYIVIIFIIMVVVIFIVYQTCGTKGVRKVVGQNTISNKPLTNYHEKTLDAKLLLSKTISL